MSKKVIIVRGQTGEITENNIKEAIIATGSKDMFHNITFVPNMIRVLLEDQLLALGDKIPGYVKKDKYHEYAYKIPFNGFGSMVFDLLEPLPYMHDIIRLITRSDVPDDLVLSAMKIITRSHIGTYTFKPSYSSCLDFSPQGKEYLSFVFEASERAKSSATSLPALDRQVWEEGPGGCVICNRDFPQTASGSGAGPACQVPISQYCAAAPMASSSFSSKGGAASSCGVSFNTSSSFGFSPLAEARSSALVASPRASYTSAVAAAGGPAPAESSARDSADEIEPPLLVCPFLQSPYLKINELIIRGYSPIDFAISAHKNETAKFLLEQRVTPQQNVIVVDKEGNLMHIKPLIPAYKIKSTWLKDSIALEVIKWTIESGDKKEIYNPTNQEEHYKLTVACLANNKEIVDYLLAKPDLKVDAEMALDLTCLPDASRAFWANYINEHGTINMDEGTSFLSLMGCPDPAAYRPGDEFYFGSSD